MHTTSDLHKSIIGLQRNLRLAWAAILLLLGLGVLIGMRPAGESISAQEIFLYSQGGELQGWIGADEDFAGITLYDQAGQPNITLGTKTGGRPALTFISGGTERAVMSIGKRGNGTLALNAKNGKAITRLGRSADGGGLLSLSNGKYKKTVHLGNDRNGRGLMELFDKGGRQFSYLGTTVDSDGRTAPMFKISNPAGKEVLVLGATQENSGFISVMDASGEPVWGKVGQ